MRLTFLGHAMVRVELAGTVLLTDPLLRARVTALRWFGPPPDEQLLADVDAVLVSHLHHDHCDPASLRRLGLDVPLVVPSGAEGFFLRRGFRDVVGLAPGEHHRVRGVEVTATEAEHDGRRHPGARNRTALGFVLGGGRRRVYFAGDTDLFDGMADLGSGDGHLDVALVPVTGWGRRLGPGHLDPVRAAEAVRLLQPAIAVPIHWGALRPVWHRAPPVGWTAGPPSELVRRVHHLGLATEVVVLQPGGSLTLPP